MWNQRWRVNEADHRKGETKGQLVIGEKCIFVEAHKKIALTFKIIVRYVINILFIIFLLNNENKLIKCQLSSGFSNSMTNFSSGFFLSSSKD